MSMLHRFSAVVMIPYLYSIPRRVFHIRVRNCSRTFHPPRCSQLHDINLTSGSNPIKKNKSDFSRTRFSRRPFRDSNFRIDSKKLDPRMASFCSSICEDRAEARSLYICGLKTIGGAVVNSEIALESVTACVRPSS